MNIVEEILQEMMAVTQQEIDDENTDAPELKPGEVFLGTLGEDVQRMLVVKEKTAQKGLEKATACRTAGVMTEEDDTFLRLIKKKIVALASLITVQAQREYPESLKPPIVSLRKGWQLVAPRPLDPLQMMFEMLEELASRVDNEEE